MLIERKIKATLTAQPTIEGAGVYLDRVFGFGDERMFDPFLLLDDFRSDTPDHYLKGFPWHPHRGIETITYVLSGNVEHKDSLGNTGNISAGDVQWMTAGSGIIHQEMPKGDLIGAMGGFQLWANLPARDKMMLPRYRDVLAAQIPVVDLGKGITVKVIAGAVGGTRGPVQDVIIDPEYLDCQCPADTVFLHEVNPDHTALLYVIDGSGNIGDTRAANKTLIFFEQGDLIKVKAGPTGLRFLFMSGQPLKEPIAWRGPIVMNSREELDLAFDEYYAGTFIKHP